MLIIKKILFGFKNYSYENGVLYMLVFDFLYKQTKKLCNSYNLSCEAVACYNKKIRKGGETEKRLVYIEDVYPGYKFSKKSNYFYHKVFILEVKRYENNH